MPGKKPSASDSDSARVLPIRGAPLREALAVGEVRMRAETVELIESRQIGRGHVLEAARLAGITAAKKTGNLIPLSHPLAITHCDVAFDIPPSNDRIVVRASAQVAAATGVEMEALTAVSAAALKIYDMCKAVDDSMRITGVKLCRKRRSRS